ncbi:MAG: hypothetical protein HOP29_02885 [Phycisphaerales bacterium]|nr:hypothetical protein [Phycisphaerales bacterium]
MNHRSTVSSRRRRAAGLLIIGTIVPLGCFDPAIFNPGFVNTFQGGLFPLVPGEDVGLLLVRVVNSTDQTISFRVTIERPAVVVDVNTGASVTASETTELFTEPGNLSNEAGVLYECTPNNPITRLGLGDNLNQPSSEPGLFVGVMGDLTQGFGVPPNINPLRRDNGDFRCGDTVIFNAFSSANAPGGFKVQAFRLPQERQPEGNLRDTFGVAAEFLRNRPTED